MFCLRPTTTRYPKDLLRLADPPQQLFIRGSLDVLQQRPRIGIVGSRRMSEYGKRVLETIVPHLVSCGCCIVSGLAFGVDVTAHSLTLDSGGTTIAVLGSGIELITPRTHEQIGRKIEQTGIILSEHPGHTPAGKYTFPARNRIIAGLSDVLIVIEGTRTSGSLITADFMLQLGKDIFAVPGNIDAPLAQGPNFLIAHGAHPLLSVDELSTALGFDKHPELQVLSDVSAEELAVLTLLAEQPTSVDDLCTRCELPTQVVNATLTALELKGGITRSSNGLISKR